MKPYHQQTYYELLEISPAATQDEIRSAYERQVQTYAPDSVAIYSLADPAQAEDLRKRILEAFEYLSDSDLRDEYDKSIGIDPKKRAHKPAEAPIPVTPPAPEPVAVPAPVAPPPAPVVAEAPPAAAAAAPPAPVPAAEEEVPEAEADLVSEEPASSKSVTPPPPAAEPSQLQMLEILNGTAVASSNFPKVSVSYIPHPPRPERPEPITVAAPSWSVGELPSEPARTPAPRTESGERRIEAMAEPLPPHPMVPYTPPPPPALTPPPMQPVTVAPLPNHTPPAIAPAEVAAPPSHTPPAGPPRIAEPIKPPPLPDRKRAEQLAGAPELAQESAIAQAEAALAQVASRLREPRPKPFDVPQDAEFNGELLRKIRQSKNLSVQQVAERTKISSRHLENVEADRYDALPATVYLRGIIMNLAREYGLDPLRVSKSYLGLVPEKK